MKRHTILYILSAVVLFAGGVFSSGAIHSQLQYVKGSLRLPTFQMPKFQFSSPIVSNEKVKVVSEENIVIDVVDKVSPSVVTVGISQTKRIGSMFQFDPFDPFSQMMPRSGKTQKVEQDIGSGFIVEADGLIVTNKHVVADTSAKYRVITKDNKSYDVVKIYRDPANDLAVVKINASGLTPVEMGDSDKIKVGQMAIAIGTALGEFRNTVTVGVVSGVGRGITAGSPFEGDTEKLDNVIQTSAAINPGNSGGPLLNSSGQVIGVNTAVASDGQNIGFAQPINVVKDALANFNSTGQFNRPFLGVEYRMVTRQLAVLNDLPEGAYISSVVDGSPAAKAGVEGEDIIIKIDGDKITESNDLAKVIGKKKVGDNVSLTIWRGDKEVTVSATLGNQE